MALAASLSGEKLQPLVIGKSANPRCFKKIKTENFPVMYRNNPKAWMTGEIMTQWLRKLDKDMRKQVRKILLFLDNAPSHPHMELSNVLLCFSPQTPHQWHSQWIKESSSV